MRHFVSYDADYYLILAGDHLFRMDFSELIEAHVASHADITIAAQPVNADDATQMGIFKFDTAGQIVGFEEKPSAERLGQIGASVPPGAPMYSPDDAQTPFVASMGIYVFSRQVLHDVLERHAYIDFGREVIPAALGTHRVRPYLFRGYWADVGTIESFYEANVRLTAPGAPFNFYDPHRPIYTNSRFLPPSLYYGCTIRESLVAEGCFMDDCHLAQSVVIRSIDRGLDHALTCSARITRVGDAPTQATARCLAPGDGARSAIADKNAHRRRARLSTKAMCACRRRRLVHPLASSSCPRATIAWARSSSQPSRRLGILRTCPGAGAGLPPCPGTPGSPTVYDSTNR
jgi:glucose-1-phosphate adenylyltransferase